MKMSGLGWKPLGMDIDLAEILMGVSFWGSEIVVILACVWCFAVFRKYRVDLRRQIWTYGSASLGLILLWFSNVVLLLFTGVLSDIRGHPSNELMAFLSISFLGLQVIAISSLLITFTTLQENRVRMKGAKVSYRVLLLPLLETSGIVGIIFTWLWLAER